MNVQFAEEPYPQGASVDASIFLIYQSGAFPVFVDSFIERCGYAVVESDDDRFCVTMGAFLPKIKRANAGNLPVDRREFLMIALFLNLIVFVCRRENIIIVMVGEQVIVMGVGDSFSDAIKISVDSDTGVLRVS